ncbi:DUF4192 domain-containing protein [Amycolatopsis sp. TRM77291]
MPRTVRLASTSDVFAAIPPLLGYVPHRSFVLIFFCNGPDRTIRSRLVARVDLDQLGRDPAALAHALTRRAMDLPVHAAIGLVVCPNSPAPDSPLPYRTEILALTRAIEQLGFRVSEVGHIPDFIEGAPWHSYLSSERTGVLPDPCTTAVAATMVSEGFVTARSRDELAAVFTPAPPEDRARLEPQVQSAVAQARADRALPDAASDRLDRADSAITAAVNGDLPVQDREISDLIATFSVEPFRSANVQRQFDRSSAWMHRAHDLPLAIRSRTMREPPRRGGRPPRLCSRRRPHRQIRRRRWHRASATAHTPPAHRRSPAAAAPAEISDR